jgi:hypothetical protein
MLSGWKTNASGYALIMTGMGQILNGLAHDLDWNMVIAGFTNAGTGLGVLGIGHKVEKARR